MCIIQISSKTNWIICLAFSLPRSSKKGAISLRKNPTILLDSGKGILLSQRLNLRFSLDSILKILRLRFVFLQITNNMKRGLLNHDYGGSGFGYRNYKGEIVSSHFECVVQ